MISSSPGSRFCGHDDVSLQMLVSGIPDACQDGKILRSELVIVKTHGEAKLGWQRKMLILVTKEELDGSGSLFLLLANCTNDEGRPYRTVNSFSVQCCHLRQLSVKADELPGFVLVGKPMGGFEDTAPLSMTIHPADDDDNDDDSCRYSWLESIEAASSSLRRSHPADEPACDEDSDGNAQSSELSPESVYLGQLRPTPPHSSLSTSSGAGSEVHVCSMLTVDPPAVAAAAASSSSSSSSSCFAAQLWLGLHDGRIQVYDGVSCLLLGEFRAHDAAVEGMVLLRDAGGGVAVDGGGGGGGGCRGNGDDDGDRDARRKGGDNGRLDRDNGRQKRDDSRRNIRRQGHGAQARGGGWTVWSFSATSPAHSSSLGHPSLALAASPPSPSLPASHRPASSLSLSSSSVVPPSPPSSLLTGSHPPPPPPRGLCCSLRAWSVSPVAPLSHRFASWTQDAGGGGGGGGAGRESIRLTDGQRASKLLVSGFGSVLWIGISDSLSSWKVDNGKAGGPRQLATNDSVGGATSVQGEYRTGGLRMESVCAVSEKACWVGSRHAIRVWVCNDEGGMECVRQLSLGAKQLCLSWRSGQRTGGGRGERGGRGNGCTAAGDGDGGGEGGEGGGKGGGKRRREEAEDQANEMVVVAVTSDERVAVVRGDTGELLFRVRGWEEEGDGEEELSLTLADNRGEVLVVTATGEIGLLDMEQQRVQRVCDGGQDRVRQGEGRHAGCTGQGGEEQVLSSPFLSHDALSCSLVVRNDRIATRVFALSDSRESVAVFDWTSEGWVAVSGRAGCGTVEMEGAGSRRRCLDDVRWKDAFCEKACAAANLCGVDGVGTSRLQDEQKEGGEVGAQQQDEEDEEDGKEDKRAGAEGEAAARWHFDGEVEDDDDDENDERGHDRGSWGGEAGFCRENDSDAAGEERMDVQRLACNERGKGGGRWHEVWYLARMGKDEQERLEWRRLERDQGQLRREWGVGDETGQALLGHEDRFDSIEGRWEGPVSVTSSWVSAQAVVLEGNGGRCWTMKKRGGQRERSGETEWMHSAGWGGQEADSSTRTDLIGVEVDGVHGRKKGDGGVEGGVCAGMSMGGLLVAREGGLYVVGNDRTEMKTGLGVLSTALMEDERKEDEEENETWNVERVSEQDTEVLVSFHQAEGMLHHVGSGCTVMVLACGLQHCAMVTEGGALYTWGNPAGGVLGLGEGGGLSLELVHIPTRVCGFGGRGVVDVACGHTHTLACAGGKAFVWGSGLATAGADQCDGGGVIWEPAPLSRGNWGGEEFGGGSLVVSVGAGANFGCVLTAIGEVVTFGRNRHGALGHGHTEDVAAPGRVEALWRGGVLVRQVRCGRYFMAAVTDSGGLYVWGTTGYPGLSDNSPILVPLPSPSSRPLTIACSADHLLVVSGRMGAVHPDSEPRRHVTDGVLVKGGCELELALAVGAHRKLLASSLALSALTLRAIPAISTSGQPSGAREVGADLQRLALFREATEWGLEDLTCGLEWMQRVLVHAQCRWQCKTMSVWVSKAGRAVTDVLQGGTTVVEKLREMERRAREERVEAEFMLLKAEERARRPDDNVHPSTGVHVGWGAKAVRELRELGVMGAEGQHVSCWPLAVKVRMVAEDVVRHGVVLRALVSRTSIRGQDDGDSDLTAAVDLWREAEREAQWAVGMCSMEHIGSLSRTNCLKAKAGQMTGSDDKSMLLRWVDATGVGPCGKKEGVWRVLGAVELGGKGKIGDGPTPRNQTEQPGTSPAKQVTVCIQCQCVIPERSTKVDSSTVAMCKACATKDVLLRSGMDMVVGRRGVGGLGGGEEGVGLVLTSQDLTVVQGKGGVGGGWSQTIALEALWVTVDSAEGHSLTTAGGIEVAEAGATKRRNTFAAMSPEATKPTPTRGQLIVLCGPECRLQLMPPSVRAGRDWAAAIVTQIHARLLALHHIPQSSAPVGEGRREAAETCDLEGSENNGGWEVSLAENIRTRWMTYEFQDGIVYEGAWKDGMREGFGTISRRAEGGTFSVVYAGWFSCGEMHGRGLSFSGDGAFSGEFRGGQREGYGMMRYGSGDEYRGGWERGMRRGRAGRWTGHNGDRYEGGWEGDQFGGRGTLSRKDGGRYEGFWENGLRNGWGGREEEKGGWVFYGGWREDCREGLGGSLYDGMAFVGFWRRGVEDGPGILFLSNGDRMFGTWGQGQESSTTAQVHADRRCVPMTDGFYVPKSEGEGGDVWVFLLAERDTKPAGLAYMAGGAFGGGGGSSRKEREFRTALVAAVGSTFDVPESSPTGGVSGRTESAGASRQTLTQSVAKVRSVLSSEDAKLGRMFVRFTELVDVEVEAVLWAMRASASESGTGPSEGWQDGRGREVGNGLGGRDGAWWKGEWVVSEVLTFARHVEGEVRAVCEGSAGWGERDWERAGLVVREVVLDAAARPLQRLVTAWTSDEDDALCRMLDVVGRIFLGHMGAGQAEVITCPRCGHVISHGRSAVISACGGCGAHVMGVSSPDYELPRQATAGGKEARRGRAVGALVTVGDEAASEHPYKDAVDTVRRLPSLPTPRQKLSCVSAMFAAITTTVAAAVHKTPSEVYIEPDDLIPLTCVVLAEARVRGLVGEMRMCWELVEDGERMGEAACALANLQGCVSVLLRAAATL